MKILGVLTSFYPDIDELEQNIDSFLSEIDYLIVWENTPKNESYLNRLTERLDSKKVEVRTTGQNEYLAVPFNLCAKWAVENGFTHILTMDQDSCFSSGNFANYIRLSADYDFSKIAALGPNSNSREYVERTAEVDYIFISGAIFPLNSFFKIGGFNEDLAIDAIDTEFCLRANEMGFKTVVISEVHLEHQLGYRHKHWTGLTIVSYSAQRTYYYIRNTLWLWNRYPTYFNKSYKNSFIRYRIVYRIFKLIFERDSIQKFFAICTALWHVKSNRLGRFDKFAKKLK